MKLKLAILSLFLFAAACSSNETTTAVDLDDVVETTITEEIDTPSVTTIPETTTPATTSVPKDTGHTHDEEGGHTHETIETTVPETTTTSTTSGVPETTVAPTATTAAPPKRSSGGKISYIDSPEACKANPHACDDPFSLPHIHILGTNKDGTGEQVLNTNPKHTHQEWWEHNHEIAVGRTHPMFGANFYLRWDNGRSSLIGDEGEIRFKMPVFGSAE